jgi:SAM-dependent methyltransferase
VDGRKPDVNYRIEQFPLLDERQTYFYLRRTEEAVIEAVGRIGGRGANRLRLLDVGCGLGTQAAKLWLRGWEAHGMDASDSMLKLGQYRSRVVHKAVRAVRGIAESLPYRDSSFDVVMCQGAMDHFAHPRAFVAEAARVLKPGGRLVVALANYESLSCRVGLAVHNTMGSVGVVTPPKFRFWGIPEDHTFKGSYGFLKKLARGRLRLVKMRGASMFLFLPAWRGLLEMLSFPAASAVFHVVDRVAQRLPIAADVVIAVWQKEELSERERWQEALAEWKRRSSAVPSYLAPR